MNAVRLSDGFFAWLRLEAALRPGSCLAIDATMTIFAGTGSMTVPALRSVGPLGHACEKTLVAERIAPNLVYRTEFSGLHNKGSAPSCHYRLQHDRPILSEAHTANNRIGVRARRVNHRTCTRSGAINKNQALMYESQCRGIGKAAAEDQSPAKGKPDIRAKGFRVC